MRAWTGEKYGSVRKYGEIWKKYLKKYGKMCGEVWRNMCRSIEKYVEKYGRRNMWRSMEGEIALDRNRVDHATHMPIIIIFTIIGKRNCNGRESLSAHAVWVKNVRLICHSSSEWEGHTCLYMLCLTSMSLQLTITPNAKQGR